MVHIRELGFHVLPRKRKGVLARHEKGLEAAVGDGIWCIWHPEYGDISDFGRDSPSTRIFAKR